MSLHKLLIDDQPLQVLPSLAGTIGLKEALVLQQIHYVLNYSRNEFEGFRWVYNTYEQWQEEHFPFLKTADVKCIILRLEKLGLLVSSIKFNKMKMDKTKWYRIDYEALNKLEIPEKKINRSTEENLSSNGRNSAIPAEEILPSNNQENTQENNTIYSCQLSQNEDVLLRNKVAKSAEKDFDKSIHLDSEQEQDPLPKKQSAKKPNIPYQSVMDLYNQVNEEFGSRLPMAQSLNEKRRRLIRSFWNELKHQTLEAVQNYFAAFFDQAKGFYFGENNSQWRASFDYLLRIDTVVKVRECNL